MNHAKKLFRFGLSTAMQRLVVLVGVFVLCNEGVCAQNEPPPFRPQGKPNPNQPGPWDNDVIVYRVGPDRSVEKLATFPRAGVPTLTRIKDGRLMAAHQHFPSDNETDFDKVAVRFSTDEGHAWSEPQVIQLAGLPEGMRFPFDPTLVALSEGGVRLYFTSLKGRRFEAGPPAIYSAISSNGIDFTFEPGTRFGVEGRPVIDCAVTFHDGLFHLFAPDNGAGNGPGIRQPDMRERPSEGRGYHATSTDGLNFKRHDDVHLDGAVRWLGNALSEGPSLRFFGTGGPHGVWTATSNNGHRWKVDEAFPAVPGADPGAVKLNDGGWLLAVTGPPRRGRPRIAADENFVHLPPPFSLMNTLDANQDGTIDSWELENAAKLLRKLDRNGDGQLTTEELGPPPHDRDRPPRDQLSPQPR